MSELDWPVGEVLVAATAASLGAAVAERRAVGMLALSNVTVVHTNATVLAAATAASIVFKLLSMGMEATVPMRTFQPATAAYSRRQQRRTLCASRQYVHGLDVWRATTVIVLAAVAAPTSAAAFALAVALWAAPIIVI
jgi:hypothetical protein